MTSPSPVAAMDLSLLWTQGDWVTRSVALLLLAMSIATWSVIALKSWDLWRARRQAAGAEQFWHSASLPEGMRHLGASDSPFHQLATQGQEALAHHRQRAGGGRRIGAGTVVEGGAARQGQSQGRHPYGQGERAGQRHIEHISRQKTCSQCMPAPLPHSNVSIR